jgi:hypothetical protein
VELVFEGSRGLRLRGLNDPRAGYLIIVVTGDRRARNRNNDFQQIYVVFRGSRSDQGDALNPMMAGFSGSKETGYSNVDYAANFTGRQDTPWWCAGVKIRRGFLELYRSMSIDISLEVKELLNQARGFRHCSCRPPNLANPHRRSTVPPRGWIRPPRRSRIRDRATCRFSANCYGPCVR